MDIQIRSSYLIFPVNTLAVSKTLCLSDGGQPLYSLKIKLDYVSPDHHVYIDVSRFAGQTLQLSITPEMPLRFREADTMDLEDPYGQPLRPQIHFTTKVGWISGSCGLVFSDGVYHLCYQHNPAGSEWSNMHWGHAVSTDLIHWSEQPDVLFPDSRGMMYSGSAIVDERNVLGQNSDDRKAIALFYTTTQPFCQNLSWSTDGLKTITHHSKNPVVRHIECVNRDPKVVFCQELNCYLMVLHLQNSLYCFLRSTDLIHWTQHQRIHLESDNECPDFFPLCDEQGQRHWILIGANDHYLVGRFEGVRFVPEQETLFLSYGTSYAGQTFSNMPGGRTVRMVWDRWHLPAREFSGQLGVPTELSLHTISGLYYLAANPIAELRQLITHSRCMQDTALSPEQPLHVDLQDAAQLLRIRAVHQSSGALSCRIFGRSFRLDFAKNQLSLGDYSAPISVSGRDLDLTVIVDRCSMEFFIDGGVSQLTVLNQRTICDRNLPTLTLEAASALTLDTLEVHALQSIW